MRLTPKKIEQILVVILSEDGLPLIKELMKRDNTSEFDLATKTKKDIKIIRKQLYILYNHNIVEFTRKKDQQKGWYIYYWTLLPESIRFSFFKMKRDLLERLQHQMESETKELFFVCPNNCVRLNFDQSVEFEFHCPECGKLINQDDSKEKIAILKQKITETEEELKGLQERRKVRRRETNERRKVVKARKKEKKSKGKHKKWMKLSKIAKKKPASALEPQKNARKK